MTKEELRKNIRQRKGAFSQEERMCQSQHIWDMVRSMPQYVSANKILCYWSLSDEVDTHRFVVETAAVKELFLPVICGENLLLRKFTDIDSLKLEPSFKISEPQEGNSEVDIESIDLIIVPGMAFDLLGNRLGRGRGFYDRLLAHARAIKVGVCFDFQIFDKIPTNAYDIAMDRVIYGTI